MLTMNCNKTENLKFKWHTFLLEHYKSWFINKDPIKPACYLTWKPYSESSSGEEKKPIGESILCGVPGNNSHLCN